MRKGGNEERKRTEKTTGFIEKRMPHARCTHMKSKGIATTNKTEKS